MTFLKGLVSFHLMSFHPRIISPHVHFTPHLNCQMRLRLITKATQIPVFLRQKNFLQANERGVK